MAYGGKSSNATNAVYMHSTRVSHIKTSGLEVTELSEKAWLFYQWN